MSKQTIAGLLFTVFGYIATMTEWVLLLAPILLILGLYFTFRGARVQTMKGKMATACFFFCIVLASLGVVVSLGFFGTPVIGAAEAKYQQGGASGLKAMAPTAEALGKIYQAEAELDLEDTELLLNFGRHGTEWNRATAPLLRDFLDPEITGDVWYKRSKEHMLRVRETYRRAQKDYALIKDAGVKRTLEPLMEVQEVMYGLYHQLQHAVYAGEAEEQTRVVRMLREAGLQKQTIAVPIVRRLRIYGGPTVDEHMEEMIKENASAMSPK